MNDMSTSIENLEDMLYDFVKGVLGSWADTIYFTGYCMQKDMLLGASSIVGNHVFIDYQKVESVYRWPTDDEDNTVQQEMQFYYTITFESKHIFGIQNMAIHHAGRLVAHRGGYDIFRYVGIGRFDIQSTSIKIVHNAPVHVVTILLVVNAIINFSDVKEDPASQNAKVNVYDHDKKIFEISIQD